MDEMGELGGNKTNETDRVIICGSVQLHEGLVETAIWRLTGR